LDHFDTKERHGNMKTASIIMAAGRGSRMKAYDGNKTLLPLIPGETPYKGERPILLHILGNLPAGPKAVIVNHCKDSVMAATHAMGLIYCEQPQLNGTGGALLAAKRFIEDTDCETIIVTMGDVPFVTPENYKRLVIDLKSHNVVVLGFRPRDKKQYGLLEISQGKVVKITEWKYWKDYPVKKQTELSICNSGIYAMRRADLVRFLPILAQRPQIVTKTIDGHPTEIEEFFITDIVEYMAKDGLSIGYVLTEEETETMGIDDPIALTAAQDFYRKEKR
jgi:bifunctional UDP-N-acetylglucosamine pyrophosphorylase/glucosamine-1-phosphate N-acetyltransferase